MAGLIPPDATVLVRVPNWLGDAIMASAALTALRTERPDIRIICVMKQWVADLYAGSDMINDSIIYDHRRGAGRCSDMIKLVRAYRCTGASAAILFQTAFESALVPFLARIPVRAGRPTDHRRWLLTHPVEFSPQEFTGHQVGWYLAIVRYILGGLSGDYRPRIHIHDSHQHRADAAMADLRGSGPLIAMAPGAAYGPAKQWPEHAFAETIRQLVNCRDARILLCGGPGDAEVAARILAAVDSADRAHVMDVTGKYPLMVQAAMIHRADAAVSNDSGLMHLAAAVETPVVALFGPTSPGATGPFGDRHVVLHKPPECAPCKHRICPLDHRCMLNILPEYVVASVEKIRQANPDGS